MKKMEQEAVIELSQLCSEFGEKMHQLIFKRPIKAEHMPISQLKVLAILRKKESFKMKDITDKLSIASSSGTELIDKLIKEKLVERYRDPGDRRVVRVKLTPEGISFIDEMKERKRKFWEKLVTELTLEEQMEMLKYSRKFYTIVCKMADEGIYF